MAEGPPDLPRCASSVLPLPEEREDRAGHTVLLDWDGILDDNDKPLKFSKEKALEILADPSLRPFRDGVAWASAIVAQTEAEGQEADEGNSEAA